VKQQKEVLEQFQKNVQEILTPDAEDDGSGFNVASTSPNRLSEEGRKEKEAKDAVKRKRHKQLKRFNLSSTELLQEIDRHLSELENLKQSAASTSISVSRLFWLHLSYEIWH
jgi:hypothetical protein